MEGIKLMIILLYIGLLLEAILVHNLSKKIDKLYNRIKKLDRTTDKLEFTLKNRGE